MLLAYILLGEILRELRPARITIIPTGPDFIRLSQLYVVEIFEISQKTLMETQLRQ